MGWKSDGGELLGDEPIDLLRSCLEQVAALYEHQAGRQPTCAEIEASLAGALRFSAAEIVSDLADREVTAVSLRSRKRGRTQRFAAGDLFAIPAGAKSFYGRILKEKTPAGALVEIYDFASDQPLSATRLHGELRVRTHKHVHSFLALRHRRWPVIGHRAIPPDYPWPTFRLGSAFLGLQLRCNEETWSVDDPREWLKAEPLVCFPPEAVEEYLANQIPDPWPQIRMLNERDRREIMSSD